MSIYRHLTKIMGRPMNFQFCGHSFGAVGSVGQINIEVKQAIQQLILILTPPVAGAANTFQFEF